MRDYTDYERTEISRRAYEDFNTGRHLRVEDNPNSPPIGYVAQKVNNPDSGLQAYVLTDEKTGTPPDKVTHVTVLYRGSNEPKDFPLNKRPDARKYQHVRHVQ